MIGLTAPINRWDNQADPIIPFIEFLDFKNIDVQKDGDEYYGIIGIEFQNFFIRNATVG